MKNQNISTKNQSYFFISLLFLFSGGHKHHGEIDIKCLDKNHRKFEATFGHILRELQKKSAGKISA